MAQRGGWASLRVSSRRACPERGEGSAAERRLSRPSARARCCPPAGAARRGRECRDGIDGPRAEAGHRVGEGNPDTRAADAALLRDGTDTRPACGGAPAGGQSTLATRRVAPADATSLASAAAQRSRGMTQTNPRPQRATEASRLRAPAAGTRVEDSELGHVRARSGMSMAPPARRRRGWSIGSGRGTRFSGTRPGRASWTGSVDRPTSRVRRDSRRDRRQRGRARAL